MRYRAVISYFGARYVGWQRQLNGLSVQEVFEKALEKTFGTKTAATASGRTDAGVHAEGQVVHFDADTSIPVDKIPFAVNTHLPDDVSMLSCEVVSDDFNARFNAKRKTYCYKTYISKHRRPVLEPTHEHIIVPVDLDKIKRGVQNHRGHARFQVFRSKRQRNQKHRPHDIFNRGGNSSVANVFERGFRYGKRRIADEFRNERICHRQRFSLQHGAHNRGHVAVRRHRKTHSRRRPHDFGER